MPRLMSFAMTTEQIRNRTKDVTRRLGWANLKIGEELRAVTKGMGLKKGESPEDLALIRVVSVDREPLRSITDEDVAREGYPGATAAWFVRKFCDAMRVDEYATVTRIEFEYVEAT